MEQHILIRIFSLQGTNGYDIKSKDVLINSLPTTLIDIDTKEVQQTNELRLHLTTRFEFLRLYLSQILEGEAPVFPTK